MNSRTDVALIIPALDEEATIASTVREARLYFDGDIVVVDNGSTDATAAAARDAGARVVIEPVRGYGRACMAGVAATPDAKVLVFMDGDGSDMPARIPALLAAIEDGADLALGVRRGPEVEPGSTTVTARSGNWLCLDATGRALRQEAARPLAAQGCPPSVARSAGPPGADVRVDGGIARPLAARGRSHR